MRAHSNTRTKTAEFRIMNPAKPRNPMRSHGNHWEPWASMTTTRFRYASRLGISRIWRYMFSEPQMRQRWVLVHIDNVARRWNRHKIFIGSGDTQKVVLSSWGTLIKSRYTKYARLYWCSNVNNAKKLYILRVPANVFSRGNLFLSQALRSRISQVLTTFLKILSVSWEFSRYAISSLENVLTLTNKC